MADIDGSGSLSEAEFVLFKLQAMGVLQVSDVSKVTRKFRVELNPGPDGEVQIPTDKYLQQCIKTGMDFNYIMRTYQQKVEKANEEKKTKEAELNAEHVINKRKLGVMKGAINKIMVKIDVGEGVRTELKKAVRVIYKSLPQVEVSREEIREEVHSQRVLEAKRELKKLVDLKENSGVTEDERKEIEVQKVKISTEKAASKVMSIVHSNRRRTMETKQRENEDKGGESDAEKAKREVMRNLDLGKIEDRDRDRD